MKNLNLIIKRCAKYIRAVKARKAEYIGAQYAEDVTYLLRLLDEKDKEISSNRIGALQYKNLRKCFSQLVTLIFGGDYYNEGLDVYTCDEFSCRDIWNKVKKRRDKQWCSIQDKESVTNDEDKRY